MTHNLVPNGTEALHTDPRFGFAWKAQTGSTPRPLLIAVHDSLRDEIATRDAFADLVHEHGLSILAPRFPAGAISTQVVDGFKFLREPGADYVALLDEMISQFSLHHPVNTNAVFLFGFSGGAQFAHRYALIRASRLRGVVLAAPGNVTRIDDARDWWAGTADVEAAIGYGLDHAGLRKLRVHVMAGAQDLSEGMVSRPPGSPYGSSDENLAGITRRARSEALARSLKPHCLAVDFQVLKDVGHEFPPVADAARKMISRMLTNAVT